MPLQSDRQWNGSKSNAYNFICSAGVFPVQHSSRTDLTHYKFRYLYFPDYFSYMLILFHTGQDMYIPYAQELPARYPLKQRIQTSACWAMWRVQCSNRRRPKTILR